MTRGGGADLFVDSRIAEADLAALQADEAGIAEERQRQALGERTATLERKPHVTDDIGD